MNLVSEARRASGLTQAELAVRARMPQSSIARAEAAGANPGLRTLERVLRACGHRLEAVPAAPASVDESLVAARLPLSPGERILVFERNHAGVEAFRGIAAA